MNRTVIHDRIDALHAGEDPFFIAKLETCWVVLANRGFLRGHCIVFADPVVFSVNDLDEASRMKYWRDVSRVGDALMEVTGSYRINYETLCNQAQALHSHVIPRQLSESDEQRRERAAFAYQESEVDLHEAQELIAKLKLSLA